MPTIALHNFCRVISLAHFVFYGRTSPSGDQALMLVDWYITEYLACSSKREWSPGLSYQSMAKLQGKDAGNTPTNVLDLLPLSLPHTPPALVNIDVFFYVRG